MLAVWSDDGEQVAFVIQRFDVSYPRNMPREDRNEHERFELWTSTLDGSEPVMWRADTGSVGSFYSMRNGEHLTRGHDGVAWRWCEGVDELDVVALPECRPPISPATTSSLIAGDGRLVRGTRAPDDELIELIELFECSELGQFERDDCEVLVPFGCPGDVGPGSIGSRGN